MRRVIYYYTGTGNSLAAAKDFIHQSGTDWELIPIMKLLHLDFIQVDADIVGVFYPVWLHHIPPSLEEFIGKVKFNVKYLFAVCSYSVSQYNSIFNLNKLLEQKGRQLDAGFALAMGGKYVLLKDLVFSEEENKERYINEKIRIKEITEIVNNLKRIGIEGKYEEADDYCGKKLIDIHRNVYKVTEKFKTTDKCDLCGLCADICPRKNIKIENGGVLWKDNCDFCSACLHWCPKAAILNGELSVKSRRHHHPEISADDIINQS